MKLIYLISRAFLAWTFFNFLARRVAERVPETRNSGSELEKNLYELKVLIFFLIIRQDSLLDIVTSLGADEEKIILAGTAKANRFNLLDVSRNTPGSASVGMASTITYQQVCSLLLLHIIIIM